MEEEIAEKIHECAINRTIRFKKHALVRCVERGIKIGEIVKVLENCQIITVYPDDKPLKSYLILGLTKNKRPLHIVVALKQKNIFELLVFMNLIRKNGMKHIQRG